MTMTKIKAKKPENPENPEDPEKPREAENLKFDLTEDINLWDIPHSCPQEPFEPPYGWSGGGQ